MTKLTNLNENISHISTVLKASHFNSSPSGELFDFLDQKDKLMCLFGCRGCIVFFFFSHGVGSWQGNGAAPNFMM